MYKNYFPIYENKIHICNYTFPYIVIYNNFFIFLLFIDDIWAACARLIYKINKYLYDNRLKSSNAYYKNPVW